MSRVRYPREINNEEDMTQEKSWTEQVRVENRGAFMMKFDVRGSGGVRTDATREFSAGNSEVIERGRSIMPFMAIRAWKRLSMAGEHQPPPASPDSTTGVASSAFFFGRRL